MVFVWGRLGCVVVLAACNQVYGLDETRVLEAADGDGDGIADAVDNCVDVANRSQGDEDEDLVGDACDNCPAIANAMQEHRGDADAVGDLCDPHPAFGGDCVILVETFADPATFDTNWDVIGMRSEVHPAKGFVELAPGSGDVGIVARGLDGKFDVELHGGAEVATNARVEAVSNATTSQRYWCALYKPGAEQVEIGHVQNGISETDGSNLSSAPATAGLTIRLTSLTPTSGIPDSCRIDHGVAIGSVGPTFQIYPDLAGGNPGAFARGATARIDTIIITQVRTGACPTPVIR